MTRRQQPEIDWSKVFDLRCRAKRGEHLTTEDQRQLERAYRADPDRYSAMTQPAFKATLPFGAE